LAALYHRRAAEIVARCEWLFDSLANRLERAFVKSRVEPKEIDVLKTSATLCLVAAFRIAFDAPSDPPRVRSNPPSARLD
jgi:hypothetical protein